jgi:hypothetical protein
LRALREIFFMGFVALEQDATITLN